MDAGEKVAVAPVGTPVTLNVTALPNVLPAGLRGNVNTALPPRETVWVGVVAPLSVKLASVPVPLRLTLCGAIVPPFITVNTADFEPTAVGAKLMLTAQFADAARLVPQVFVCTKLAASVPVIEKASPVKAVLPVLETVTCIAALLAPICCDPKLIALVDKVICGPNTLNVTADELFPEGLMTVICAVPADANSVVGASAVNCVALTYTVPSAAPFHSTVAPGTNPLPVTVIWVVAVPTVAELGVTFVKLGVAPVAVCAMLLRKITISSKDV